MLKIVSEKKAFVNFWLACFCYGEMKFNIHRAMLKIDVHSSFEKMSCSRLSPYVTSIPHYSRPERLLFLLKAQQSCPRLKSMSLNEDTLKIVEPVVRMARNIETLCMNGAVNVSFLQKFRKLRTLSLSRLPTDDLKNGMTLNNVTDLSLGCTNASDSLDFYNERGSFHWFPNLVRLEIDIEHYVIDEAYDYIRLDLSDLPYLEKLRVFLRDMREDENENISEENFLATIDVIVSGEHLKKVMISPNIALISMTSAYPSLTDLTISNSRTYKPYSGSFKPMDVFSQAPNIRRLSINASIVHIIPLFEHLPRLTHLDLDGLDMFSLIDYGSVCNIGIKTSVAELKLAFSKLVELQHLGLKYVEIHPRHVPVLTELCSKLSSLEWDHVHHPGDLVNGPGFFAPNKDSIANLRSLKASLDSPDWILLIPLLTKIPSTDLTLGKIQELC
jgi:hypothetical protein